MRFPLCVCALAVLAGTAAGQQPAQSVATPPNLGPPVPPVPPECAAPSAITDRAISSDSLCLTRQGAIVLALRFNLQLQIAGAQVQQSRALKVQGVAMPDPTFGAEWDGSPGPFGIGGGSSRVLGASITIPFFDKFRLNGRIGTAGIRSSESDSITVRQGIASQTSQTYDSLLASLRHRADLRETDSLAGDFLKKTQARFDAGTAARLDVVNAQVAVAQAENSLIANDRDIGNARAALNRLLGRALGASLRSADSLAVPPALPDLDQLTAAALRNRPELISLEQQQRGARATTDLAREFWYPDFTIGISKDFLAGPTPGYLTTGISFPIPVFYWNHARGEIAQDHYREQELDATYRDAQAAVGQDVRVAYAAAATALRQAVFIRDQLVPASRQAYRIAAASYGLGGSSALEVNAAFGALVSAESQFTDALAAASSARADLERAVAAPLVTFATGASQ